MALDNGDDVSSSSASLPPSDKPNDLRGWVARVCRVGRGDMCVCGRCCACSSIPWLSFPPPDAPAADGVEFTPASATTLGAAVGAGTSMALTDARKAGAAPAPAVRSADDRRSPSRRPPAPAPTPSIEGAAVTALSTRAACMTVKPAMRRRILPAGTDGAAAAVTSVPVEAP